MNKNKSKYHRLTFSQFFQKPISCQQAIAHLAELLLLFKKNQLMNILCQIGKEIHLNPSNPEVANSNLLKRFPFATIYAQKLLEEHKELDGSQAIIFDPKALRILNSIILINFPDFASNIMSDLSPSKSYGLVKNLLLPMQKLSKPSFGELSIIIPLFLLSNEIVNHMEREKKEESKNTLSESIDYYFNALDDPLSVLGRTYNLFSTDYFNNKMREIIGANILEIAAYFLILYTQILVHDPARIESDQPCKNSIPDENERIKLKKLLDEISLNYKSRSVQALLPYLEKSYFGTDASHFRGKPYTIFENLLYCIRPDLLVSTMCDFPYLLVFNSLKEEEKVDFSNEFGTAFENYIKSIVKIALGEDACSYYTYKKRKGDEIPCGDLILQIDEDTIIILEVKGAKEDDRVRTGSPQKIDDKFVTMDNKKKKVKGVRQLFNSAGYYRLGKSFKGDIYTIIIFYGRFPETIEFDDIVVNKICITTEYQKYNMNSKNHPTIWLNCFAAELLFSALKQNKSLFKDLISKISGSSPSSITENIWDYMRKNNLKTSLFPLFKNELELVSSHVKKLLSEDPDDLQMEKTKQDSLSNDLK